ncbi:basic phospholipase A2 PA-12C-like isoform X2 [Artemia franciscana]|uniref:basic phospholipase A2 PA-12C-like isoform X2 n=1 Tax=Artemia franciscana TaxID=6661 RepID=UPI0032DB3C44
MFFQYLIFVILVIPSSISQQRNKRDVIQLGQVIKCATKCDPLKYTGYGCYCGFLGHGRVVDGIDKCCKDHDSCYGRIRCRKTLLYFTPYRWQCNHGRPRCEIKSGASSPQGSCAQQLCECDRAFAECIRHYPCPHKKASCPDNPLRNV